MRLIENMETSGNTSNVSQRGIHTPIRRAPMYHSTIRKTNDPAASMREGGGGSLLRAARSGNVTKLIHLLDQDNIDISTSNSSGLAALHLASKEGHCDIIKELLQRNAPIDQPTKRGNTALHIASLAGKLTVVQLLIENGADANCSAQNAFTPLYMAAQEGHDEIVEYLLKHGANQSISTEDGFTPLAVALQENKDKVVALLLDNDVKGRVKLPALHIAARKDDVKAAALLLQNDNTADTTSKMMVNRITESGFTALHIAAHYGNVNVATLLLNRGAIVDFKARNGITPMHVAAKRGHTRFCSLLLERDGKADSVTRDGLLPLHCAARSGHLPIVKLFLGHEGTPKFTRTKNGLSALHMAAQGGHIEIVELLLQEEFSVDDSTSDYLSALHIAAHCGHVEIAQILITHKAHVDCKALNGFTPLHVACKKNQFLVVELLLNSGADAEAVTESGLTPLHIACFMGHFDIVEALVSKEAKLNTVNVRGETALHMATRTGQTDIVTYLLRQGIQPDARKQESQTCLHLAAKLNKHDIVKLLIKYKANVNSLTHGGYTPLHVAAKEGNVEICETLLENNASVALTTKKGFTPLHLASKYGRLEVASLLLKNGSSPDACGQDGLTPLHVAAHFDNQQAALLLLQNGASPHSAGKNGYTPLHIAAKKNQMDIALSLLEYRAPANSKTRMDVTPLHLAAQEGHTDMCSVLIARDANVNAAAKFGITPMHLAAQDDRVSVAKILYDGGSLVDPLTKAGCTPLHVASHHGNIKVANYLLSLDAKVNAKTKNGYTPLHQAAQQGHTHVVNLLLRYGASANELTNSGNTALSLAKRLGYITVVDTLKTVTTETTTTVTEEKRKMNIPETLGEVFLSDASDDEGDGSVLGSEYLTTKEMRELGDDSIVPTEASLTAISRDARYSTMQGRSGFARHTSFSSTASGGSSDNSQPTNLKTNGFLVSFMVDARGGSMRASRHPNLQIVIPSKACRAPTRITCRFARKRQMSSLSPSFNISMFDAEGKGARVLELGPRGGNFLHKLHNPANPPPLVEGTGLAMPVIQLGPKATHFLGPVAIEIPHYASLENNDRQLSVLRSNDGQTWKEHKPACSDEEFRKQYSSGVDLESKESLASRRIVRIVTTNFPRYFAVVSRPIENAISIGESGGKLNSSVVNDAYASFPEGALTKQITVALQMLPVTAAICRKAVGNKAKASSILTIEPRRRKFHKPIKLAIPLPEGTQMKDYLSTTDDSTLRLLCSISGGANPAQWEDISGSTPLNFVDNCVTFTSTVSARFWLIDCRQASESTTLAHQIYKEATRVPYMAKFVVFAKSLDTVEANLRLFCLTEDNYDKALENYEHYCEVARSRDVEVLEGSTIFVECSGNIIAASKASQQHKFNFSAFTENRLPVHVKVRDSTQEPSGRLTFYQMPAGPPKTHGPRKTLCNLNIVLPPCEKDSDYEETEEEDFNENQNGDGPLGSLTSDKKRYYLVDPRTDQGKPLSKKHALLAAKIGIQWPRLAGALGLSSDDIWKIQMDYDGSEPGQQSSAMISTWSSRFADTNEDEDTQLRKALTDIGREDLCNLMDADDEDDKLAEETAKPTINDESSDASGFNALQDELGSPYPTKGDDHISTPFPFKNDAQNGSLFPYTTSTPTAASKARNETITEEDNESDDPNLPHFSYMEKDGEVFPDKENADFPKEGEVANDSKLAASEESDVSSVSTTQDTYEMTDEKVVDEDAPSEDNDDEISIEHEKNPDEDCDVENSMIDILNDDTLDPEDKEKRISRLVSFMLDDQEDKSDASSSVSSSSSHHSTTKENGHGSNEEISQDGDNHIIEDTHPQEADEHHSAPLAAEDDADDENSPNYKRDYTGIEYEFEEEEPAPQVKTFMSFKVEQE